MDRTSTLIRDILNPDFATVNVNDASLFENIKSYVRGISPEMEKIVKLYKYREPILSTLE